jgi:hypothetical protein
MMKVGKWISVEVTTLEDFLERLGRDIMSNLHVKLEI